MFNQIYSYLFDSITSDSVNNYTNFYYLTLIRKDENSPWSIHGLWPQTSLNSYPTFCRNVDFDVSKIEPIISKLERCSKSSKRSYVKKQNIPKVLNGFGLSILSTSKGVMCGKNARLKNVGGELLGIIW